MPYVTCGTPPPSVSDALDAVESEPAWRSASRDALEAALEDLLVARVGCTDAARVTLRLRAICRNAAFLDTTAPAGALATVSRVARRAPLWRRWWDGVVTRAPRRRA